MVQTITFFEVASQHAKWLSERQKVVAENIANANTPGYRSKDVDSFDRVLNSNTEMARTNALHFKEDNSRSLYSKTRIIQSPLDQSIGIQVSGNTVGLTNELYKSGQIKYLYSLNNILVGKLNSMMMSVSKG
ncbi:flagellar basal body rod protein FlgB [Candidatus Liberibacter americanus]|uniref:Flagellar basal body rod protein FlgB n=1 Tax=Candidatus Liberibacter americanus str. Sao Paulo TaxID=1261131 RepID=U6B4U4_9HYPH|nr:flagellar basal body rod protein FlgB [Candidatus Liberibacter americanus]AHA27638.1 Flagellar basal body protein [Candidatus Liberibacter americanus str. Sao Paulo]EMS36347.1 flagellar basal body rod protein FlgB [Candidatus Liberibacter americanus PW_SP]